MLVQQASRSGRGSRPTGVLAGDQRCRGRCARSCTGRASSPRASAASESSGTSRCTPHMRGVVLRVDGVEAERPQQLDREAARHPGHRDRAVGVAPLEVVGRHQLLQLARRLERRAEGARRGTRRRRAAGAASPRARPAKGPTTRPASSYCARRRITPPSRAASISTKASMRVTVWPESSRLELALQVRAPARRARRRPAGSPGHVEELGLAELDHVEDHAACTGAVERAPTRWRTRALWIGGRGSGRAARPSSARASASQGSARGRRRRAHHPPPHRGVVVGGDEGPGVVQRVEQRGRLGHVAGDQDRDARAARARRRAAAARRAQLGEVVLGPEPLAAPEERVELAVVQRRGGRARRGARRARASISAWSRDAPRRARLGSSGPAGQAPPARRASERSSAVEEAPATLGRAGPLGCRKVNAGLPQPPKSGASVASPWIESQVCGKSTASTASAPPEARKARALRTTRADVGLDAARRRRRAARPADPTARPRARRAR